MYTVSSSIPDDLLKYSNYALEMDQSLLQESFRLASALWTFSRQCTEYPVHPYEIEDQIARYARTAVPIEEWVRKIANDFIHADRLAAICWWRYPQIHVWRPWEWIFLTPQWRVTILEPQRVNIRLPRRMTFLQAETSLGIGALIKLFIRLMLKIPKIYAQNADEYGPEGGTAVWIGTIVDLLLYTLIDSIFSAPTVVVGAFHLPPPITIIIGAVLSESLKEPQEVTEEKVFSTPIDERLTEIIKSIFTGQQLTPPQSSVDLIGPAPTPAPIPNPGSATSPAQPTVRTPRSPFQGEYRITASYPKYSDGKLHSGVDLKPKNSSDNFVYPIAPGKIVEVGYDEEGYGYYVKVQHQLSTGETVYSLYAHLNTKPSWKVGDSVDPNSTVPLGVMGSTGGRSTGPHLHLSIFNTKNPGIFDGEKADTPVVGKDGKETGTTLFEKMERIFFNPLDIIEGRAGWEFRPVSEWEDQLKSNSMRDTGGLQWAPAFA